MESTMQHASGYFDGYGFHCATYALSGPGQPTTITRAPVRSSSLGCASLVKSWALIALVLIGVAACAVWVHHRAAFPATLQFSERPDVVVDGEPWLGFSGQCACFRRSLRVEARDGVVIDLEDRAVRGQGTIELRALDESAPT